MLSSLSVTDVSRVASDAVREEAPDLEVVGVTFGASGGDYAEVLLRVQGCQQPCQILLGVFRDLSEVDLHTEIAQKLRRHAQEHPRPSPRDDSNRRSSGHDEDVTSR